MFWFDVFTTLGTSWSWRRNLWKEHRNSRRARTEIKASISIILGDFFDSFACFRTSVFLHLVLISVETTQIQKESAVINDRKEEHNRACSELKRLQVKKSQPPSANIVYFTPFLNEQNKKALLLLFDLQLEYSTIFCGQFSCYSI